MKVVIDIPDEDYKDIIDGYICQELADEMLNRVKDGTPLVKELEDRDRRLQSKLISKVSYNIAEQYSRHGEVIPEWLTIGNIRVNDKSYQYKREL